jgi:hypothetical protein
MKKLPENWCIQITKDNKETVKSWFINYSGISDITHYSFSIDCYYHSKSDRSTGHLHIHPGFKQITFEQFKQYVMGSKFTTVTREQFQKGYKLACGGWQQTLMNEYGKDLVLNDTVDIDHSFIDKLKSAASNDEQRAFLKELFPNPNEVNAQDLEIGEAMKVTDNMYKDALIVRIHGGEFVNMLAPNQTWGEGCTLQGFRVKFKVDIIED